MWVPSQHGKWDVVMQGETSIADGVVLSIPYMPEGDWRSLWKHPWSHHGPYQAISAKVDPQISYKIQGFRYPLIMGNGVLCCKVRHPLLLDCLIILHGCTWKMTWASDYNYKALADHMVPFLPMSTFKLYSKCKISGTLSAWKMGWCNERGDIQCLWSVP